MSHKLLQNLACHKGAEHLTGPLNYNAHFKFLYTYKYALLHTTQHIMQFGRSKTLLYNKISCTSKSCKKIGTTQKYYIFTPCHINYYKLKLHHVLACHINSYIIMHHSST